MGSSGHVRVSGVTIRIEVRNIAMQFRYQTTRAVMVIGIDLLSALVYRSITIYLIVIISWHEHQLTDVIFYCKRLKEPKT